MSGAVAAVLAGAALGAGATGGAALLLYTQQGFLATAGFLIALCMAALAAGVWAGSGDAEPARTPASPRLATARRSADRRPADPGAAARAAAERGLARAWTAAVVALGAAAAFSAVWTVRPQLREAGAGGAAAALFLLAAPAYTIGQALGRIARNRSGIAVAALVGAGLGVLVAAVWVIPRFDAPYLFLGAGLACAAAAPLTGRRPADPEETRMSRVVIVTGAGDAGQVGWAIAQAFLAAGDRVVVTDVTQGVETLGEELGDGGFGVRADLTRAEDAERVVAAALERFGRVDALINVAGGLGVMKRVEDTTADEWSTEIARNATTAFVTTRAALPSLRRSRGAVVSFASPAAVRGAQNLAAYSAAKAAVVAFTRAAAVEERPHGVRLNAIAPGMIDTAQNRARSADDARFVSRDEIARVVLFLASDAAAAISGETIQVLGDTLA